GDFDCCPSRDLIDLRVCWCRGPIGSDFCGTQEGGLGVGTTITSSVLFAVLAILVGWQMLTGRRQTRTVDTVLGSDSPHHRPAGQPTE
ncbi:hypothetical protein ACGFZ9_19905, partial [Streptomyces mirabilis]|uniref:hypothetical protein n=1 Tax=Streptomyces mirabilis TaxID=68239 RepID=UPI00371C2B5F